MSTIGHDNCKGYGNDSASHDNGVRAGMKRSSPDDVNIDPNNALSVLAYQQQIPALAPVSSTTSDVRSIPVTHHNIKNNIKNNINNNINNIAIEYQEARLTEHAVKTAPSAGIGNASAAPVSSHSSSASSSSSSPSPLLPSISQCAQSIPISPAMTSSTSNPPPSLPPPNQMSQNAMPSAMTSAPHAPWQAKLPFTIRYTGMSYTTSSAVSSTSNSTMNNGDEDGGPGPDTPCDDLFTFLNPIYRNFKIYFSSQYSSAAGFDKNGDWPKLMAALRHATMNTCGFNLISDGHRQTRQESRLLRCSQSRKHGGSRKQNGRTKQRPPTQMAATKDSNSESQTAQQPGSNAMATTNSNLDILAETVALSPRLRTSGSSPQRRSEPNATFASNGRGAPATHRPAATSLTPSTRRSKSKASNINGTCKFKLTVRCDQHGFFLVCGTGCAIHSNHPPDPFHNAAAAAQSSSLLQPGSTIATCAPVSLSPQPCLTKTSRDHHVNKRRKHKQQAAATVGDSSVATSRGIITNEPLERLSRALDVDQASQQHATSQTTTGTSSTALPLPSQTTASADNTAAAYAVLDEYRNAVRDHSSSNNHAGNEHVDRLIQFMKDELSRVRGTQPRP